MPHRLIILLTISCSEIKITDNYRISSTVDKLLEIYTHFKNISDSARHWSQDICPLISQIVLKNFIKISLIIKECSEFFLDKTGNCREDFKV